MPPFLRVTAPADPASGDRAVFDLAVLEGETDHPYRLQYEQSKYGQLVLDALGALVQGHTLCSTAP